MKIKKEKTCEKEKIFHGIKVDCLWVMLLKKGNSISF